jgi:hypothetical protein
MMRCGEKMEMRRLIVDIGPNLAQYVLSLVDKIGAMEIEMWRSSDHWIPCEVASILAFH